MAGIYIHIPFCKQACYYCDFHFSTSLKQKTEMVNAICKEIELQQDYLKGELLETIYFGGGTPSLLDLKDFEKIFNQLNKYYSFADLKEVTIEANPDDLSKKKINELKNTIINRFSIGIQSFFDKELQFLNRAHSAKEALNSIKYVQDGGFENITIDLIFGIPTSSIQEWEKNIEQALELNVPHLSCYALTIEEKTVFGNWLKKGKIKVSDDDVVNSQFELLMSKTVQVEFEQYEISNYAKPNYQAVHNTNYWKGKKYLGIGPGAHSYNGESRQYNIANNPKYIKELEKGNVPFELEMLTKENQINEYIMTSLRTSWGCDINYLIKNHCVDIIAIHKSFINKCISNGLIVINEQVLILTNKGKLIADEISSELFIEKFKEKI